MNTGFAVLHVRSVSSSWSAGSWTVGRYQVTCGFIASLQSTPCLAECKHVIHICWMNDGISAFRSNIHFTNVWRGRADRSKVSWLPVRGSLHFSAILLVFHASYQQRNSAWCGPGAGSQAHPGSLTLWGPQQNRFFLSPSFLLCEMLCLDQTIYVTSSWKGHIKPYPTARKNSGVSLVFKGNLNWNQLPSLLPLTIRMNINWWMGVYNVIFDISEPCLNFFSHREKNYILLFYVTDFSLESGIELSGWWVLKDFNKDFSYYLNLGNSIFACTQKADN